MPPKTPECKAAQYNGPLPALGRDGVTLYTIVEDTRRGSKAWRVVKSGSKKPSAGAAGKQEEKNAVMSPFAPPPSQQQQQSILYQPTFLPAIGDGAQQQQQQYRSQEVKSVRARKTYFQGHDTLFSSSNSFHATAPSPLPNIVAVANQPSVIDMDVDMSLPHCVNK